MNFYDRWVLPPILDLVMRQNQLERYRREVVGAATGRVLEVGVGSGLNFPLYGKQVEIVVGIDPSPRLLAIGRRRADAAGVHAEFLHGVCDRNPYRRQHNRHGGDDLGALFDPGPTGCVTRDATGSQAGRQVALRRTWAFSRPRDRTLATQTHAYLVPCCRRLSPGSEDGRPYSLCGLRSDRAPNGIRKRATSNDLHVSWTRRASLKASNGSGVHTEGRSQ